MTEQTVRPGELPDTTSIREFMSIMGQDTPATPVQVSDDVRVLRGVLLIEETLELLEAMGLKVTTGAGEQIHRSQVQVVVDESLPVDLVEMAKESADLTYVNKGAMLAFGLPADEAFAEVHRSNLSKLDENGLPIRREDGKIIKGPNYRPADISAIVTPLLQDDTNL